jgi:hypothetical protein
MGIGQHPYEDPQVALAWYVVNHDTEARVGGPFADPKDAARLRRRLERDLPDDDDTNYWIEELPL